MSRNIRIVEVDPEKTLGLTDPISDRIAMKIQLSGDLGPSASKTQVGPDGLQELDLRLFGEGLRPLVIR